jgi:CheY-like chemotaxis protein
MVESAVRLLHVDDDESFGQLTALSLVRESERFDVETATSGAAALDRLAADEFDCVVSDYDMPGMDGLELLEAVRARHGRTPFVLFTGKGSEHIASAAISAGVDEYLQKTGRPEQFTLLANRVSNVVDRHRARRARERLLAELRTEREHFGMALRDSPVVAFRLDADLRYTWVGNPHPGFDSESVLGRRDDELLPPPAAETVLAPKREALESGRPVRRQVSYELHGAPVTYDLTVDPVTDGDGTVVGLACVAVELDEDAPYLEGSQDAQRATGSRPTPVHDQSHPSGSEPADETVRDDRFPSV